MPDQPLAEPAPRLRVGLIADTHGLLRAEAVAALAGCDQIVHAGDIGPADILDTLRSLAPLSVVRGNNDQAPWCAELAEHLQLRLGHINLYLTHRAQDLPVPLPAGIDVVVTGHSHKPEVRHADGVLHINPGSAGPRRFRLPISLALLHIDGNQVEAELIELTPSPQGATP